MVKKIKKVKKIPQREKEIIRPSFGGKETKEVEAAEGEPRQSREVKLPEVSLDEVKVEADEVDTVSESQKAKEIEKEIDQKEIKLLEEPKEKQVEEEKKEEENTSTSAQYHGEPERRILDFIPDEVEESVSWLQKKISAKTFIISHFLLFIVGLIFALGLYYLLYNSLPFSKVNQIAKYMPITTQPTSFNFEIKNPDNELWVFSSSINVSGKSSSRASVVISNNDKDYALSANPNGEFSKVISLDTGINEITITGFDDEGNSKLERRTIFYSEEKPQ